MTLGPMVAVALLALATASIAAPLPMKPPFSSELPSSRESVKDFLSLFSEPSSSPQDGKDVSGNLVHAGSNQQVVWIDSS
ncbi:hypothetical protein ACQY0O_002407 [Thecaphora frezii]